MSQPRAKGVILLAAVVVAVVGLVWFLGDERRIMKEVDKVVGAIEKAGVETELEAFSRSRTVTEIFAPSFEVRAEDFGFASSDRRSVAARVHMFRAQSETIDVDILERELTIEGDRAEMMLAVAFSGATISGVTGREVFRFRLSWVNVSGWRVQQLELVEIVENSGRLGF